MIHIEKLKKVYDNGYEALKDMIPIHYVKVDEIETDLKDLW